MCHFVSRVALMTLLFLGVPVGNALACIYFAGDPSFDGMLQDGATDVPTDVMPYFASPLGFPLFDAQDKPISRFTLATASGESVPLLARPHGNDPIVSGFELLPMRALAANTSYVLTAHWVMPQSEQTSVLHFTTGAGPLTTTPPPPAVSLRHFHRPAPRSSCDGPEYGTCVTVTADAFVEAVYIDEFGQAGLPTIYRGWFPTNLSGREQFTNHRCVRLRTRALNGTYSQPVEACGADYPGFIEIEQKSIACGPGAVTESVLPDAGSPVVTDAAVSRVDASVQPPSRFDAAVRSPDASSNDPEATAEAATDGCSLARSTSAGALNVLLALAALLSRKRQRSFASARRA